MRGPEGTVPSGTSGGTQLGTYQLWPSPDSPCTQTGRNTGGNKQGLFFYLSVFELYVKHNYFSNKKTVHRRLFVYLAV